MKNANTKLRWPPSRKHWYSGKRGQDLLWLTKIRICLQWKVLPFFTPGRHRSCALYGVYLWGRGYQTMKLLFVIVLIFVPSQTIAALEMRDARLLRIAFLHGFEAAITMNDDDIKQCRGDYAFAYRKANVLANRYVSAVRGMNWKDVKIWKRYEWPLS